MVSITPDPKNSDRIVVSQTVTVFLDKILFESLSSELESIIRRQAEKDLKKNKSVQQAVAQAASNKLLEMLSIPAIPKVEGEQK